MNKLARPLHRRLLLSAATLLLLSLPPMGGASQDHHHGVQRHGAEHHGRAPSTSPRTRRLTRTPVKPEDDAGGSRIKYLDPDEDEETLDEDGGHADAHDHGDERAADLDDQDEDTESGASRARRPSKAKATDPRWKRRSEAALVTLEPDFEARVRRVLARLEREGWEPVVVSGRRSKEQQRKIVAAGRSRTMKSLHLCGRAADIMDHRHGWRGPAASPKFRFWVRLGVAARAEGLIWGGDWKSFQDVPHIQIGQRCP